MRMRFRLLCLLLPVLLLSIQVFANDEERSFIVINAASGLADNSAQVVKQLVWDGTSWLIL